MYENDVISREWAIKSTRDLRVKMTESEAAAFVVSHLSPTDWIILADLSYDRHSARVSAARHFITRDFGNVFSHDWEADMWGGQPGAANRGWLILELVMAEVMNHGIL